MCTLQRLRNAPKQSQSIVACSRMPQVKTYVLSENRWSEGAKKGVHWALPFRLANTNPSAHKHSDLTEGDFTVWKCAYRSLNNEYNDISSRTDGGLLCTYVDLVHQLTGEL